MKKAIILLTLILVFVFIAACGNEPESPTQEVPATTAVQEIPAPTPEPEIDEVTTIEDVEEEVDELSILRDILGVEFTIEPWDYALYTWDQPWYEGDRVYRWQFLELSEPLNLNNFPTTGDYPFRIYGGLFHTELGDVLIATHRNGNQYLYIHTGTSTETFPSPEREGVPWYNRISIDGIELNPERTYNWDDGEIRFQNRQIAAFSMTLQYSSEHIDWFSTDEYSQWLPEMAEVTEARLQKIIPLFGFELPGRINAWYFSNADFHEMHPWYVDEWFPWMRGTEHLYYGGNVPNPRTFGVFRPVGTTVLSNLMIENLVHEAVHVVQSMISNIYGSTWNALTPSWLLEGAATYFERRGGDYLHWEHHRIQPFLRNIRNNNIPTLDYLEDGFYFEHDPYGINYAWGATIVQFVTDTWGFDYVVEMHRRPLVDRDYQELFGISRAEFERQWHEYVRATDFIATAVFR